MLLKAYNETIKSMVKVFSCYISVLVVAHRASGIGSVQTL